MNSYLKITGRSFTIWLLASLINGLISSLALVILKHDFTLVSGYFIVISLLSLFFSVPGFFIFWLVLLVKAARHQTQRALFRSALSTGFILSAITGYLGSQEFSSEFLSHRSIICSSIISSAMISIMLHFKHFKTIK